MNVGIVTDSVQFLFWKYKNGIFVAVRYEIQKKLQKGKTLVTNAENN